MNRLVLAAALAAFPLSSQADALLSGWLTSWSGKYARIYTNDTNKTNGISATTWTNGTQTQSNPAYCGVQEVSYSSNWVYVKTTGLGSHIMGPWLNGSFPNLPKNQNVTYRFPRTPTSPASKTLTGGGTIGLFVDGVAMFDSRDAFYWNGSADTGGTGAWNRDAYVNESATFDPAKAHQENSGTYHYHANPIALRYLLGDHVDFNGATKAYSESTAPVTKHSPLLGFVRDGYPVYGPYGYASAMNANSGVRRMISGYALRDGSNGTDNLTSTGRSAVPAWATRLGYSYAVMTGPTVSTTYPLGRYVEDNAYLGDLGKTQGTDFDLDEYNGRLCVTPEYPAGTYAYFVAINADGTPKMPYNIGRAFRGSPTGSATAIAETVTTAKYGPDGTATWAAAPTINGSNVALSWSSVEGGTYEVQASTDLVNWTALSPTIAAATNAVVTTGTETGGGAYGSRFYKLTRTALATYDGSTGGGGGTTSTAPGGSAARGTTVTVTITVTGTVPPLTNPQGNAVNVVSATLAGSITGTSLSRPTQTTVQATFTIPANATTGAQSIVVVYQGPTTPTFTVSPFTIN